MQDSAAILQIAIDTAYAAGPLVRAGHTRPLDVSYKGDKGNDPVTDVDKLIEAQIVAAIRLHYPNHRILSEEGTTGGDDPDWRWIIDPLDGTSNYSRRITYCCISIGVEHDGHVVAGVIYDAFADELFAAAAGQGATLNGSSIHVSSVDTLEKSLLVCPAGHLDVDDRRYHRGPTLAPVVQSLRDFGASALDLAYLATGRIDGVAGVTLQPWDVAGGLAIVREAGGVITDLGGNDVTPDSRHFIASNGHIHQALVTALRQSSEPAPRA